METEPGINDIRERERERESSHSDKTQQYLCMVCDKRFMTRHCLKRHKVRHTDEQLYSCAHYVNSTTVGRSSISSAVVSGWGMGRRIN